AFPNKSTTKWGNINVVDYSGEYEFLLRECPIRKNAAWLKETSLDCHFYTRDEDIKEYKRFKEIILRLESVGWIQ
ncbi:MAG: hypothetical protein AABX16_00165, partial [Nanoarchaeota archaeon]